MSAQVGLAAAQNVRWNAFGELDQAFGIGFPSHLAGGIETLMGSRRKTITGSRTAEIAHDAMWNLFAHFAQKKLHTLARNRNKIRQEIFFKKFLLSDLPT
jgi:hypothetical protein